MIQKYTFIKAGNTLQNLKYHVIVVPPRKAGWERRFLIDQITSKVRKESYDVCFTTVKGKHYRIKLAQNVWEKLDVNAHYLIRRNIFGKITEIARTNKI